MAVCLLVIQLQGLFSGKCLRPQCYDTLSREALCPRLDVMERARNLAARKATADDTEAIQLARDMMLPPNRGIPKLSLNLVDKSPQGKAVEEYYNGMRGGVFVEAGAFDGSEGSNTIRLELDHSWSGLLVEADPDYFMQMVGKRRNASCINACVSPTRHVSIMQFSEASGGLGQIQINGTGQFEVPCFPLSTLLQAANITELQYLSLDVEGLEVDVLETIEFTTTHISVITAEFAHGRSVTELVPLMTNRGYILHSTIQYYADRVFAQDYMFVKTK